MWQTLGAPSPVVLGTEVPWRAYETVMSPPHRRPSPSPRLVRLSAIGVVMIVTMAVGGCTESGRRSNGTGSEQPPPGSGTASSSVSVSCGRASTQLSFVSTRDGREEIYVLDINRPQDATRITDLPGAVEDPTWSPDGRHLAFRWFHNGSVGLYVASADGSNVRLLADGGVTPDWSPDGRLIAYARAPGDIWVVNVQAALRGHSSSSRVLIRRNARLTQMEYPRWSPDGKHLLFAGYVSGSFDVWVADAEGTHVRDITPQSSLEYSATWSPDGTKIVFDSNRDTTTGDDLYIVDSDGSNLRRITSSPTGGGPAWSPDGRWIAFVSTRDGNTELYIMRPDGTNQRRLTNDSAEDLGPVWLCRVPNS